MGISRAKYLQLVDQYPPDSLTRAPERRLDEAIRALIGQPEMAKLISYQGLPDDADVRLEPRWHGALWVDYVKRKTAFADPEDGSEFWVDVQWMTAERWRRLMVLALRSWRIRGLNVPHQFG
jgi:hypothetical protein